MTWKLRTGKWRTRRQTSQCRPHRRGISCCCGSHSWTAVLLLTDVDTDLSEKLCAVYLEPVTYGAQKLKFRVCSGIISRDACLAAGVILKISLFLWSTYSNAAFQVLQSLPFCRQWHSVGSLSLRSWTSLGD